MQPDPHGLQLGGPGKTRRDDLRRGAQGAQKQTSTLNINSHSSSFHDLD
jgi:hypothetical protein